MRTGHKIPTWHFTDTDDDTLRLQVDKEGDTVVFAVIPAGDDVTQVWPEVWLTANQGRSLAQKLVEALGTGK